jgi:ribosomal protein S18 acetylase RimI-like enzyme
MVYRKIETEKDVDTLVPIAHEIWSDHFETMFDKETLPMLIEGAQSKRAILSQIEDGSQYFFIDQDDRKIGYFAYKMDQSKNELLLSKIYVYSDQRGKGVGRKVLNHLEKLSHDAGVNKIVLTVNHKNIDSIKAYEKWGFSNLGLIKRQFENGLVVEDIIMEKSL